MVPKSKRNVSKQKGVRKLPQVKEILHYPKMKMMHLDLQKNKKVLRKKRLRMKIFGSAGIVQMKGMKMVMNDV